MYHYWPPINWFEIHYLKTKFNLGLYSDGKKTRSIVKDEHFPTKSLPGGSLTDKISIVSHPPGQFLGCSYPEDGTCRQFFILTLSDF